MDNNQKSMRELLEYIEQSTERTAIATTMCAIILFAILAIIIFKF